MWDRRQKVPKTDSIKYFRIADLFLFVIPQFWQTPTESNRKASVDASAGHLICN